MSSTTPLTDAINALIARANSTTDASDTTLNNAVERLIIGYGDINYTRLIEKNIGGDVVYQGTEPKGAVFLHSKITSVSYPNVSNMHGASHNYAFAYCLNLETLNFPNLKTTTNTGGMFFGCDALTSVYFPKLEVAGSQMFANCDLLKTGVFPSLKKTGNNMFMGCPSFETFDYGKTGSANTFEICDRVFNQVNSLKTLILRPSDQLVLLYSVETYNISQMQQGGTGVDIYIPEILYNHLGDGSSLDYQSANNWSTVYGYGTITWKKIEGSIYETQYADGTPIPTT